MKQVLYTLPDGRVCYPFPWESSKEACPWKPGYQRVVIPFTASEKQHSSKKCHIQIVRSSNLTLVKPARLTV